ncbi:hypothetical protein HYV44_03450 [Candidatus Microgenomates bacterium]|nr:hypothetical protein [Candidatus Microgenomates bacterium]
MNTCQFKVDMSKEDVEHMRKMLELYEGMSYQGLRFIVAITASGLVGLYALDVEMHKNLLRFIREEAYEVLGGGFLIEKEGKMTLTGSSIQYGSVSSNVLARFKEELEEIFEMEVVIDTSVKKEQDEKCSI